MLAWALLVPGLCGSCAPADAPNALVRAPDSEAPQTVHVREVTDGDSVLLNDGRRVRYLGIDCPESSDRLFRAAREANRRAVAQRPVVLAAVGEEKLDRYGRVLGLIYHQDGARRPGASVNAELLQAGLAWVYRVGRPLPDSVRDELLAAQLMAIKARRGVWKTWLDERNTAQNLVASRRRIHRKDCESIRRTRPRPVVSLEDEFRQGKSPCRECQPVGRP